MNPTHKKILTHLVELDIEYSKQDFSRYAVSLYVPNGQTLSKHDLQKQLLENPENDDFVNALLNRYSRIYREAAGGLSPLENEKTIAHAEQRLGITLPQDLKEVYLAFGCNTFFLNFLSTDNGLYENNFCKGDLFEAVYPLADYIGYAYYNYENIEKYYENYFDNDIEWIQELNHRFIAFGLYPCAGEKMILLLWDIKLQKYALFPFYQDNWRTMNNLLKSEYSVYDTFEDMVFNIKTAFEKKYFGNNFP